MQQVSHDQLRLSRGDFIDLYPTINPSRTVPQEFRHNFIPNLQLRYILKLESPYNLWRFFESAPHFFKNFFIRSRVHLSGDQLRIRPFGGDEFLGGAPTNVPEQWTKFQIPSAR